MASTRPAPKPNQTLAGELACKFGEPWLGPHPLCAAKLAADCGVPVAEVPAGPWTFPLADDQEEEEKDASDQETDSD